MGKTLVVEWQRVPRSLVLKRPLGVEEAKLDWFLRWGETPSNRDYPDNNPCQGNQSRLDKYLPHVFRL
jgi:hypothetical protein